MIKRQLGKSGLEVAPLAFGGNVFGWTADEATSFKLLDAFVGAGFNLIDTANSYSRWVPGNKGGESETIIGHWLRQRPGARGKVLIATKLGADMGNGELGLSKAYIFAEVERSLKRLDTDHIDLYQSHRDDDKTPIDETLEAYGQLVRQGKVRVIGASNFTAARLAASLKSSAAHGYPRYESRDHVGGRGRAEPDLDLSAVTLRPSRRPPSSGKSEARWGCRSRSAVWLASSRRKSTSSHPPRHRQSRRFLSHGCRRITAGADGRWGASRRPMVS